MDSGLLDIRPPPLAPEGIGVTLIVAALLLMATLALLLRCYRSPRQRARRALKRLRRTAARGTLDNRAAAHALANLLRQGLGSHLQRGMITPDRNAEWVDFADRLAEARFAHQSCSSERLSELLDETESWLEKRT